MRDAGETAKDYSYRKRRARVGLSRQHLAAKHAANPERVKRFEARMAALGNVRRREHEPANPKRWCILRTSPISTISLTDALEEAGYEVWTPTEIVEKRVGRSRDRVDRLAAIMPGFIFAASGNAADLLRLSGNPSKQVADYSVFLQRDRIPLIADTSMDTLRDAEADAAVRRIKQKQRDKTKAQPFVCGDEIKMSAGAFGGLPGFVEESDGRFTLVCFGKLRVKIDTFILRSDII